MWRAIILSSLMFGISGASSFKHGNKITPHCLVIAPNRFIHLHAVHTYWLSESVALFYCRGQMRFTPHFVSVTFIQTNKVPQRQKWALWRLKVHSQDKSQHWNKGTACDSLLLLRVRIQRLKPWWGDAEEKARKARWGGFSSDHNSAV